MVWVYFWDLGWFNLYIINRDFESQKYRYSTNSYIKVLDAELALIHEKLDLGYIFIQDNTSIHCTKKVKA